MPQTLANDPRVIVMLLASASASGSWGLGGFFAVLLNPLWLLFLCCCCCACATALARCVLNFSFGSFFSIPRTRTDEGMHRARETVEYAEIPGSGAFYGQGYTTGFGSGGGGGFGGFGGGTGGFFSSTQYV